MARSWNEVWSFGAGPGRMYCGISRTAEGYAVDLFCGDTCLDSFNYDTRVDAARATEVLKLLYGTEQRNKGKAFVQRSKGSVAAHL